MGPSTVLIDSIRSYFIVVSQKYTLIISFLYLIRSDTLHHLITIEESS